ncbi:restriction endonuclease [Patescibacteria group bacterium]|nr:restriction endonuclease [Patescibacteria group bacterium]MBU1472328.1 restriction endonuclease [Patescibacteria group bacterium]MBU2460420.1 restriction endonuclease [Patescibacteria group bacterium]MBU2544513.1 restriction endonuclease [Patescibacteria group bacterium]
MLFAFKQANLEDYVENFINRFGFEKKKHNVWSFRNYSFDWDRLNDFRKFLHDKGLDISTNSWNDTIFLLQYYIQKKEENLTTESIAGSISVVPRKFADLSGADFESLLFRLFTAMGYAVQKTGKTGDQGGDLVINKDQQRTLIQAKCYKDMPVGNSAIQEAVAAQKFYDCTASTVVTNSGFTKEAIELARVNKVELIGATRLREVLLQYLKDNWN